MKKPRKLLIGRWCPFHNGHKYLVDSFVNNGQPVLIAVRDTKETFTAWERVTMIRALYPDNDKVLAVIIPDIDQVVIGRGVGYSVVEAPEEIQTISGTNVRAGTETGIPVVIKEMMEELISKKELR